MFYRKKIELVHVIIKPSSSSQYNKTPETEIAIHLVTHENISAEL